MSAHLFERETWIDKPLNQVFDFFSDARNLAQITPPWLHFQIMTTGPIAMAVGTNIAYRLKWHGIPICWKSQITVWNPPFEFCDVQLTGPYRLWRHTHRFASERGGTKMTDIVQYELPLGWLGEVANAISVRDSVKKIFEYRADRIGVLFDADD